MSDNNFTSAVLSMNVLLIHKHENNDGKVEAPRDITVLIGVLASLPAYSHSKVVQHYV